MDNRLNNNSNFEASKPAQPAEAGRWVPVDAGALGFQLKGNPNEVIQGPDGKQYCISNSEPQYGGIASNSMNAIPTPSSIVQMPPIVQPIALVPYTSQNQPLLQYDPYSRPLDPPATPKAPNYVRKPYSGISLALMILAIVAGFIIVLFASASFKANTLREAFNVNMIGAVKALLLAFGLKDIESAYYTDKLASGGGTADFLSKLIAYAIPILIVVIFVIFIVLFIKYLRKLIKKQTPRAFSIGAFINIILCLALAVMLLGMSNAEVVSDARSENVKNFFLLSSTITVGIGLLLALLVSIAMFILPFFARKNAYMLERTNDANRTFIIND